MFLIFSRSDHKSKISKKGGFFPDGRPAIGTQQTFLLAHTKCLQVHTKSTSKWVVPRTRPEKWFLGADSTPEKTFFIQSSCDLKTTFLDASWERCTLMYFCMHL